MDLNKTALVLVDMQNDFLHAKGAYARGGASSPEIATLKDRLVPVVQKMREKGGWIVSTHFTLVPGKSGEPFISPHLKKLRPFLQKGDFTPKGWGQALIDELAPADIEVEKVAFSAFYMSRLEWVLNRAGIERLIFSGIVTNGGVASTVRDAHVRDFELTVLEDGCAAFKPEIHETNIAALASIAEIKSCADLLDALDKS
jgi:ureidoacrylate peracid hydrolase